MIEQLPLFVFGTLRNGECNHHLLEGNYDRSLPAELHGFTRIHPLMIARDEEDSVEGELYFIQTAKHASTMQNCDRLEGIPPGETAGVDYRRIRVSVLTEEGSVTAWVYVHPDTSEK